MELKSEDKLLLSRANDCVERARSRYAFSALGFLSPAERTLIERSLPRLGDVNYMFWGGYDTVERTMFVCFPDYMEFNSENAQISALEITGREISRLSHRDFLGSALALGIKREKIGDILAAEDRCLMFAASDIAEYIRENLTKIGNAGVAVAFADFGAVEPPERNVSEISGTVASLRLDAVLSVALKVSRSAAAELIAGGLVHVNWELALQTTRLIVAGDIFSVKGFGRFRLGTIGSLSKKGRHHIVVEKYL